MTQKDPINIICMKWGDKYGADYVNRLYGMVNRNLTLPFNFVCFTENPEGIHSNVKICPLPSLGLPENIGLKIIPHQNLQHPFLLTWQHRKNIISLKDEYDYFMYLEDDISVSYDALEEWREDSNLLFKHNKIRGFIRCEENANNEIVSTDYLDKIKCKEIVYIDKKILMIRNV